MNYLGVITCGSPFTLSFNCSIDSSPLKSPFSRCQGDTRSFWSSSLLLPLSFSFSLLERLFLSRSTESIVCEKGALLAVELASCRILCASARRKKEETASRDSRFSRNNSNKARRLFPAVANLRYRNGRKTTAPCR